MKLQIFSNYPPRLKTGDFVEVDRLVADSEFAGGYRLRVVGVWSKPKWLAISFFVQVEGS